MGYFANGSQGDDYQARYCEQCVHWREDDGCPCWNAHELWNYDEANKPDSLLHKMIPLTPDYSNRQCIFFRRKGSR